jgi:hypothetical protein
MFYSPEFMTILNNYAQIAMQLEDADQAVKKYKRPVNQQVKKTLADLQAAMLENQIGCLYDPATNKYVVCQQKTLMNSISEENIDQLAEQLNLLLAEKAASWTTTKEAAKQVCDSIQKCRQKHAVKTTVVDKLPKNAHAEQLEDARLAKYLSKSVKFVSDSQAKHAQINASLSSLKQQKSQAEQQLDEQFRANQYFTTKIKTSKTTSEELNSIAMACQSPHLTATPSTKVKRFVELVKVKRRNKQTTKVRPSRKDLESLVLSLVDQIGLAGLTGLNAKQFVQQLYDELCAHANKKAANKPEQHKLVLRKDKMVHCVKRKLEG